MNKFSEKFPYLFHIKTLAQRLKDISDFYLEKSEINTSLGMILGQINCSQNLGIPINRKHLENALKISGPSVSNLLTKLEKKGSIVRSNNKLDNRNLTISITQSGQSLLEDTNIALSQADKLLTQGMSSEEKEIFLNLLQRSLKNLENMEQEIKHEAY